ncbi:MAG: hypothetical protein ACLRFN_01585 [Alphaproteobacteria bacterium]
MNLNIINLPCDQWTKEDWNDAYSQYCRHNQFEVMDKRQYYDFVHNNHKRLKDRDAPLSAELASKWSAGRNNVRLWAKKHDYRATSEPEPMSVAELAEQVRELEWKIMNKKG